MTRWTVALFLLLALAVGGSAQGIIGPLALEVLGIFLVAAAYLKPAHVTYAGSRALLSLCWAGAVLIAVQLVPLPPLLWQALPGRELMVAGDDLLGLPGAWRPISLIPEATLAALAEWTVFLGVLTFGLRRPDVSRSGIVVVIVAAALLGALIGLAQRTGLAPHYYPFSSSGPTGQFANTNHLAALALAAIPMVAALAARAGAAGSAGSSRLLALTAVAILVVTIVLTGAVAMILLILPVLAVSALIVFDRRDSRRWVVGLLALMCVAAAGSIMLGSLGDQHVDVSAATRLDLWRKSFELSPFMAAGAGFGSFESLYHLVEDPFLVDRFYVNHAHNDLIELALEGGIPALLLLGFFVAWAGKAAFRAWRGGLDTDPFARGASVVVAILLLHSLVDFPLRTLAHLALMASSLLLLATSRPAKAVTEKGDIRPTRHRQVA